MVRAEQTVISASRRTDIPAFYMDDFMAQIRRGWFERVNPYNRKTSRISAMPEHVHTIVFMSKDFSRFLHGSYPDELIGMGYHLYFHFTVNSECRVLEPGVPPLADRLAQLEVLCGTFGAQCVTWRFDPVCFFSENGAGVSDNMNDFSTIAAKAGQLGIRRCIAGFMNDYPKIQRRTRSMPAFSFVFPSCDEKRDRVLAMKRLLEKHDIDLLLCCEKELLETLPPASGIRPGACISNDLFMELFGGRPSLKRDMGQRVKHGCGCMKSVDVGCYHRHPCRHNCLYCYANPADISRAGNRHE
ncbi:MAG: DUF1848 family protein [Desulfobacterales bacterium]